MDQYRGVGARGRGEGVTKMYRSGTGECFGGRLCRRRVIGVGVPYRVADTWDMKPFGIETCYNHSDGFKRS